MDAPTAVPNQSPVYVSAYICHAQGINEGMSEGMKYLLLICDAV
jgi:hypothetical protein